MFTPLLLTGALAAPTVRTLDNGLTVVVDPDTRTDTVALYLRVGVGSRDEGPGETGMAHLFEHLMFEGSGHVPNNAFDTWLTAAGGDNNAWTSGDETVYHMSFPSGALDLALFLESDRWAYLSDALDAGNLSNQQSVVLQERATGFDQPYGEVWDALQVLTFPLPHPYGWSTLGTIADVEGFELDTVRAFFHRHYRPRNAVLVIVGQVDAELAHERAAHWFSDVPDRGLPPRRVGRPPDHVFASVDAMLTDKVDDVSITLSWPTVAQSHPDRFALDVLSRILTGTRRARLDAAMLYRRGAVIDVWAASELGEVDGQFVIDLTSAGPSLERLVRLTDKEVGRVVRRGVTRDEVDSAVRSILYQRIAAVESLAGRAEALLTCMVMYDEPACETRERAAYQAVTPADVQRVARAYLDPHRRVSLSVVPEGMDEDAFPGAEPVELP